MDSAVGGPSMASPSSTSIQFPGRWTPCQHYLSEDLLSGLRQNGRMSVVRRFFCLFATFDLLLTGLIWLICLVLAGNFDFYTAFKTQILHYHIQTSIFDIVMAAGVRFTAIILFYALLHINHWIVVALTTAGTCVFLVAKVYVYNWTIASQPVLQVLLILSSFILSWAEAWFLDLRVIPQEKHAREYINAALATDEAAPLLQKFLDNSRFDALSESMGSRFYSPVATPDGSDDEDLPYKRRNKTSLAAEKAYQLKMLGEDILQLAWETLNNNLWVVDTTTKMGDTIYSQRLQKGPKVFLLSGVVDADVNTLFNALFKNVEGIPQWNPTIKTSKMVQFIDESTDITYQVSGMTGGVIKNRDFVLLRHWKWKDDCLVIASASVPPQFGPPPDSTNIRGENGPSCWSLKEIVNGKTEVRWLINTNIKGWVPQQIVDTAFRGVLSDYMGHLRVHLSSTSSSSVLANSEDLPG